MRQSIISSNFQETPKRSFGCLARSITRRRVFNSGFTLIEMLIVLLIAAILTAWGVPTYSKLLEQYRLSIAVNDLVADLHLARSEITKRNDGGQGVICPILAPPVCPSFVGGGVTSPGYQAGWMVFYQSDANISPLQAGQILRVHGTLPSGFTVTVTPRKYDSINFLRSGAVNMAGNGLGVGAPTSLTVTITSTKSNQKRLICVSLLTGRIAALNDRNLIICP